MQAISVRLPDAMLRELKLASIYTGDSMNLIVVTQLREYLDGPVREQIRAGLARDTA